MEPTENNEPLLLCATFTRYQGESLSLLSGVITEDDGSVCLYLMEQEAPTFDGKENYTVISDSPTQRDFDVLFSSKEFSEALEAYQELKAAGALDIPDELLKHQIDDSIQISGISDSGRFRYEMDGITNGNMAILASCLYFMRYRTVEYALDMADEMADLYGSLITI